MNWSFSFLFFPFLAFILASEEGNPFFGSMCLIRFALYKMAMNFGIFFFLFCFFSVDRVHLATDSRQIAE